MYSVFTRTPLGTCLGFNASVDTYILHMPLQSTWDRKQAQEARVRHQEDARIIQALENACFSHQCGWRDCDTVLGSWELLRKHMEKMHCEELSLEQASSSRPYRCRYGTCQNRIFSFAPLLLEHIVSSHLEPLKLRCPLGCKQTSSRIQSLVQHLESVHDSTPYELRSAQIQRPPSRQEPLPELPARIPTHLVAPPLVRPSPSFDPSKALAAAKRAANAPKDEWSDFASLDISDASETKPFARLRCPEADAEILSLVRTIPRGFVELDDDDELEESDQEEKEGLEDSERKGLEDFEDSGGEDFEDSEGEGLKDSEGEGLEDSESDGPKVGYQYWKRRFEKETNRDQRKNRSA